MIMAQNLAITSLPTVPKRHAGVLIVERNPIDRAIVDHNVQRDWYSRIYIASNKRQAPTATSSANGRKACHGVYNTIPAMIADWGLGRGVECGMLGSAGGRSAGTCLQPSLSPGLTLLESRPMYQLAYTSEYQIGLLTSGAM